MKDFFAEYWLWILVPSLIVAAGIVLLVMASGSDSSSPFVYNIF
jgi:hypothetical protein